MKKTYKNLKLMLEWGAYPLWSNENGHYCDIDYNTLNISQDLLNEIDKWNSFYQNSFINTEYEFKSKDWTEEENKWFKSKTKELLKRLKQELPNTKIYYFNESLGKYTEYK